MKASLRQWEKLAGQVRNSQSSVGSHLLLGSKHSHLLVLRRRVWAWAASTGFCRNSRFLRARMPWLVGGRPPAAVNSSPVFITRLEALLKGRTNSLPGILDFKSFCD